MGVVRVVGQVLSDEQVAKVVERSRKLLPLGLLVILDRVFWMRLYDILIFLFVEDSLLVDIAEVSYRIEVLLFRCFLVVVDSSADLGLSVCVKTLELLSEIEQAFLQELSNTVKSLRVSLFG